MNEKSLETLEFGKILERLAGYTTFPNSRAIALQLRPSSSFPEVLKRQREVTQARRLLELKPNVSARGARDIRANVYEASIGRLLEASSLLDIKATLEVSRVVRETIVRLGEQMPLLADVVRPITDFRSIEREVSRCISERGEILDSASPALKHIRSEMRSAHDRLQDKLAEILNSTSNRLAIQEPIITLRGGRYVIPVKTEFKGQLRGIIHDTSASGATLFIEPLNTVDLNNNWREFQLEEKREIDRVLRRLSRLVGRWEASIMVNIDCLAYMDLVLAKAHYAETFGSFEPAVRPLSESGTASERVGIKLVGARHPLLVGDVVPIDVEVGEDYLALVVTGPNTGGKTVALKTVGLLAAMAQAGLHIPAGPGSRVPVFDSIYADIGDEQSIEQSLSTFSSHVRNIRDILAEADSGSLVLLDELGAGTDPTEGSALAKAILNYLLSRRIVTVATTHYNELKVFAYNSPDVENASVEFDVETLSPKYKLQVGLPGRSNALAIANRLGLPPEIIEAARSMLAPTEGEVEALLGQIQRERDEAVARAMAAELERAEVERIRKNLSDRLARIEEEKEEALSVALEGLLSETTSLREQIRRANSALLTTQIEPATLRSSDTALSEAQREIRRRLRNRARAISPQDASDLRVGDSVLIKNLGQTGEVLGLPDEKGEVEVQLGAFKARVRPDQLTKSKKRVVQHLRSVNVYKDEDAEDKTPPLRLQLDMRGQRTEEALHEMDRYLNDAYMAGLSKVRLIHGKGTGTLRQAVRQQLGQHPLVKSFDAAESQDGGEGVTIANLAV